MCPPCRIDSACPPARRVPHFALVSAQGANAGVWASDWKLFHGLLYMKTKGQVGVAAGCEWVGMPCALRSLLDMQIKGSAGRCASSARSVLLSSLLPCLSSRLACQAEEAVKAQRLPWHSTSLTPPPCLATRLVLGASATHMQAEEAVKAQRFPYASILRPGLLERGELARGMEKAVARVMSSVKVSNGLLCCWG